MPLFQRKKYDIVIVAVRYRRPGEVDWVRAYERRGPTWSDRTMIPRLELIERIRSGARTVAGERIPYLASSFNLTAEVRVEEDGEAARLVAGQSNGSSDSLEGVPIL